MAVKSMETAEKATASMEMASGALPRPGNAPEQRLLSPEIYLRQRRLCGTVLGKTPIVLGFSFGRIFIGGGASSEGHQGGLTIGGRSQGLGRAPLVVSLAPGPPPSHLRSSQSFGKNRSFGFCFV
jgi:hypothetical protein